MSYQQEYQQGYQQEYQQPKQGRVQNDYSTDQYHQDYEQPVIQQPFASECESKGLYGEARRGFIRKVYMILLTQLAITVILCAIAMTTASFLLWLSTSVWFLILTLGVSIAVCIVIACNYKLMQRVPINYLILFTYTIAMGMMVACCCGQATANFYIDGNGKLAAFYGNSYIVIVAAGITAGMVLGLTVYAIRTKTDFTMMGGMLWIALFSLMFMGMFMVIFGSLSYNYTYYKWSTIVYCTLGVIIFGMYLIYDTQLIVGGDGRAFKLGPDDYIIGAMMLYIDIIRIFLYILAILRAVR